MRVRLVIGVLLAAALTGTAIPALAIEPPVAITLGLSEHVVYPTAETSVTSVSIPVSATRAAKLDLAVVDDSERVIKQLAVASSIPTGTASYSWDFTTNAGTPAVTGQYAIVATAIDSSSNSSSARVRIDIDRRAAGSWTHVDPGGDYSGEVSFVFTPTDGLAIGSVFSTYSTSQTCYGSTASSAPYSTVLDFDSCAKGTGTVILSTAWADPLGGVAHSTATTFTAVTRDDTGPSLTLDNPNPVVEGLTSPGQREATTTYIYAYDDSGVSSVTVDILDNMGAVVASPTVQYYYYWVGRYFSWAGDGMPDGEYTARITATDGVGNTSTIRRTIVLDSTVPATMTVDSIGSDGILRVRAVPTTGVTVTYADFYLVSEFGGSCGATSALEDGVMVGSFDTAGGCGAGTSTIHGTVYWTDKVGLGHSYTLETVATDIADVAPPVFGFGASGASVLYPTAPGQLSGYAQSGYFFDQSAVSDPTVSVIGPDGTRYDSATIQITGTTPTWRNFTIYWNGLDSTGSVVPAGTYTIELSGHDSEGNVATKDLTVQVDDREAATVGPLTLADGVASVTVTPNPATPNAYVYYPYLSPNGGSGCYGSASAPDATGSYVVSFATSQCGSGLATASLTFIWSDSTGPARYFTVTTSSITLTDTVAPTIAPSSGIPTERILGASSPGVLEGAYLLYDTQDAGGIAGSGVKIYAPDGDQVLSQNLDRYGRYNTSYYFYWAGTDSNGAQVADGTYRVVATTTDNSGNTASTETTIVVQSAVPATLTTPAAGGVLAGFAPLAVDPTADFPGTLNFVGFSFSTVNAYVYGADSTGAWSTTYPIGNLSAGPANLTWSANWTDEFGVSHSYSSTAVPVTIDPVGVPLNVSADSTSGRLPLDTTLTVQTSESHGRPLTVTVSWGDGSDDETRAVAAPYQQTAWTHRFTANGVYHAVVTSSDGQGGFSSQGIDFAVEAAPNEAPSIEADAEQTSVALGSSFGINVAGTDPEGAPLQYKVTFGDGTSTIGDLPLTGALSHTYARAGTYLVRAQVSDGQRTATKSIRVTVALAEALVAVAGDDRTVTVGDSVRFDGSGSRPSAFIETYDWTFGDGTSQSGASVDHAYGKKGTYTVTLTTKVGDIIATDTEAVTVLPVPTTPGLAVTARSSGTLLAGVQVTVQLADGSRISALTGDDGTVVMNGIPDGAWTLYAWAGGYQAATAPVTMEDGSGAVSVELAPGTVATSTIETKQLTATEVKDLGIDTTAPANANVYQADIVLHFVPATADAGPAGDEVPAPDYTPVETPVRVYYNDDDDVVLIGSSSGTDDGCGTSCVQAGGYRWIPSIQKVEAQPIVQWLVIPIRASFLKEFFEVRMIVQNLSPGFTFADGSATLSVPSGISLAPTPTPQSLTTPVGDIAGGDAGVASWIVRGDAEGSYDLAADYSALVDPVGSTVNLRATTTEPLKVWGGSALSLQVTVDPDIERWAPFHVAVTLTNDTSVGTGPTVYTPSLAIDSSSSGSYLVAPNSPSTFTGDRLAPGATLTADYIVYPAVGDAGHDYATDTTNDDVQRMLTQLTKSVTASTGGNVTIPVKPLAVRAKSGDRLGFTVAVDATGATDDLVFTIADPHRTDVAGYDIYSAQSLDDPTWTWLGDALGSWSTDPTWTLPASSPSVGAYYAVVARLAGVDAHAPIHSLAVGPPRYVALGDGFSSGEAVPQFQSGTDTDRDIDPDDLQSVFTALMDDGNTCHRSSAGAYPDLLVQNAALQASLTPSAFVACSGAVTEDLYHDNPDNDGEASQLSLVSNFTDVVTMTMGRGDVDMDAVLMQCLGLTGCAKDIIEGDVTGYVTNFEKWQALSAAAQFVLMVKEIVDAGTDAVEDCVKAFKSPDPFTIFSCVKQLWSVAKKIKSAKGFDAERTADVSNAYNKILTQRLTKAYTSVLAKAPNARVLVGTYPNLFDPGADNPGCNVAVLGDADSVGGISGSEQMLTNDLTGKVNDAIRAAATAANLASAGAGQVEVVDVDPLFADHRLCKDGELNLHSAFYPLINQFVSWPNAYDSSAFSFQPTAEGQQLYADAFAAELATKASAFVSVAPGSPVEQAVHVSSAGQVITGQSRSGDAQTALSLRAPDGSILRAGDAGVETGSTGGALWIRVHAGQVGDWAVVISTGGLARAVARSAAANGSGSSPSIAVRLSSSLSDAVTTPPSAIGSVAAVGGAYRFDASGSTESGAVSASWVFADGSTTAGFTVDHDFSDAASVGARLTVTSADGLTASDDIVLGGAPPRRLGVERATLVSGDGIVGSTLHATAAQFTPEPSTSALRWLRDGVPIDGEASASYELAPADAGHTITAESRATRDLFDETVSVSRAIGVTAAPQVPTTLVVDAPSTADGANPILIGARIRDASGLPIAAGTMELVSGGTTLARATVASDGSATLAIPAGQPTGGIDIDVRYIAIDGQAAALVEHRHVIITRAAAPPAALVRAVPSITGAVRVGSLVAVDAGSWSAGTRLDFQWLRNGVPIAGATSSSYLLVAVDAGTPLSVRVTGSNALTAPGSAATVSASTTVARGVLVKPRSIAIAGTTRVGKKLRVSAKWSGVTLSYSWRANGKPIKKATKSTFTVTAKQRHKKITVVVTAKRAGYTSVSVTKRLSGVVR